LASCAGQCPGNHQSAGKRRSGRTRNASTWLDWALEEAALAATRSKDTYLPPNTPGCARAAATTKRSARPSTRSSRLLAHAVHRRDLQRPRGDHFARRDPAQATKRLVTQLEALGHTVTLHEAPAA
jgi:transposase